MKAGSFVKNKDGTLKENAKDAAMKARTEKTTKEAEGVKAESSASGKK